MHMPSQAELFWNIRRLAAAAGWRALVLLGLLGASLYVAVCVIAPGRAQMVQAQADHQRRNLRAGPALPLQTAQGQLAVFYAAFPARDAAFDAMDKLYAAAAHQNITLERGEYRLVQGADEQLTRYEIVLPVKGPYLSVRKFVAQALADDPTLALDGIAFNRQKIDEPTVDVELRLTLFLGKR
jgi:hypothetical protein